MKIRQSPYQRLNGQKQSLKSVPKLQQRLFRFFVVTPLILVKKLLGLHKEYPSSPACLKDTQTLLGRGGYGKITMMEAEGKYIAHKSRIAPFGENALQKEAHILSQLDHPCIIKSHGDPNAQTIIKIREHELNKSLEATSSPEDTEYVCVDSVEEEEAGLQTELAECDLRKKIPMLDQQERLRQALNTLSAVSYLHQQKWCHLDIKPENLLWLNNKVKLTDFDTAQSGTRLDDIPVGREKSVCTPGYAPPEMLHLLQNKQAKPVNGILCDSWSLGCTLAEIITGDPIFRPEDYFSPNGMLLTSQNIPFNTRIKEYLHQHKQTLTPKLQKLLKSMLHINPKKRITVQEALTRFPTPSL